MSKVSRALDFTSHEWKVKVAVSRLYFPLAPFHSKQQGETGLIGQQQGHLRTAFGGHSCAGVKALIL